MMETYSFGYWVRRRRKALDLSQRELAERVAYSLSAIKKIEQDMRRPSLELAEALADALAVPEPDREQFLRMGRGLTPADKIPVPHIPHSPSIHGNLPARVNPFFGRVDVLKQLTGRICEEDVRLVTITGPGGVGKSRLALEAAYRVQDHFAADCWLVSLSGGINPEKLIEAIAVALELNFAGPLETDKQLIRLLQNRHLLLILDNFEQLLPAGIDTITSLINQIPSITLLVTSRERLHLQAETIVPIQGLDIEAALGLFSARALNVGVNLMLDAKFDNRQTIEQICRHVGGLPLAVELAAAWTRLMTLDEILSELESSLDILRGSSHDLPERHHSIQNVVSGSCKRLPESEQTLLTRLSIFPSSFNREAAETICEASLQQLSDLLDHSLLQYDGERYSLHELIRHYGAAELAKIPIEKSRVAENFAAFYIKLAARLTAGFKNGSPNLTGWERKIEREIDNIHTAWYWAIENNQPQHLLNTTLSLFQYFDLRGRVRFGAKMFETLAESTVTVLRAGTGNKELLSSVQANALSILGYLNLQLGQIPLALEQYKKTLSLLDRLDAPNAKVEALPLLGAVILLTRDYSAGQVLIESQLSIAQRERHVWGEALALNFIGLLYLSQNKPEKARDNLSEAVEIWAQHPGLTFCKLRSMVHLGLTYHALQDFEMAICVQEEAFKLAQEVQDHGFLPLAICNLAFHHYAQGDLERAKKGFLNGLASSKQAGIMTYVLHSILGLGLVIAAVGHFSQAVTLLTFGSSQPGPSDLFLLGEPQRVMMKLKTELSPNAYTAAESRAHEMDLEAVMTLLP